MPGIENIFDIPDRCTMKEKTAMELKIAFLQILPGRNTDENLAIGKDACIKAKEEGADIALFPEM